MSQTQNDMQGILKLFQKLKTVSVTFVNITDLHV